MIDPSGIQPKNGKLIVKEVKPGVYTIENAYEGVHEDFEEFEIDMIIPDRPRLERRIAPPDVRIPPDFGRYFLFQETEQKNE